MKQNILSIAKNERLTIFCYNTLMTEEDFDKEVPEEDILDFEVEEEKNYIVVTTISGIVAASITIDIQ